MAPPIPPRFLIESLQEGRCVLFVGSGLSAWAKLPTWHQLLQDIVVEMRADDPDDPNLQELDSLIQSGKLLEVADYCKERLGATAKVRPFAGGPQHRAELVVAPQTQLDYAVFRIPGIVEVSPLELADELPKEGEHVTACISVGETQGFRGGTVTGVN